MVKWNLIGIMIPWKCNSGIDTIRVPLIELLIYAQYHRIKFLIKTQLQ